MSLQARYQTLSIYEFTEGAFSTPATYTLKDTFEGLIQAPSNSKAYINSKNTSSVDGILFTDISNTFEAKDVIGDTNGTKYIMSGQNSQPIGVTGIVPVAGQHAEYTMTYDNRGV